MHSGQDSDGKWVENGGNGEEKEEDGDGKQEAKLTELRGKPENLYPVSRDEVSGHVGDARPFSRPPSFNKMKAREYADWHGIRR